MKIKKQHIHYHKGGSIWAKGSIIDNKMEGYWEWFRKPVDEGKVGTKMRSGYFKENKQTGEWTTYDKQGKVVKVTNFSK